MRKKFEFEFFGVDQRVKDSISTKFCNNMIHKSKSKEGRVVKNLYSNEWKDDDLILDIEVEESVGCDTNKQLWGSIKGGLMNHVNQLDNGDYKGEVWIGEFDEKSSVY